jgi:hypothetical protein
MCVDTLHKGDDDDDNNNNNTATCRPSVSLNAWRLKICNWTQRHHRQKYF